MGTRIKKTSCILMHVKPLYKTQILLMKTKQTIHMQIRRLYFIEKAWRTSQMIESSSQIMGRSLSVLISNFAQSLLHSIVQYTMKLGQKSFTQKDQTKRKR